MFAVIVIATILKDFEIEFAPNWETKVDFVGQDQNWEKSPRYMPSLTLPMARSRLYLRSYWVR